MAVLSAATPGIGIAMSQGSIYINDAKTAGNATITDGSTVQTDGAASQVRLNDGAELRLSTSSRGTVFADHVDLQKGTARIAGYSANANGLSVRADKNSSATVSMRDQGVIQVAALTGDVHVFNAAGLNVANLLPGRALDLKPQEAGASAPSSLIGCAVKAGPNVLLTDETSDVTVQLKGNAVRAGKRVQVTGAMVPNSTPVSPATQVINVTAVKQLGGTCKAGTAAAAAGGAAAGGAAAGAGGAAAGAAAGISTTTAVVAGVAAATAVGVGAGAATGAIGGSSTPVSAARTGAFQ
ncbi:MAG: hypothetical protein M3N93_10775 [Acidobacteriota bacterium]|nr:hypothetical protein [Acidobacteriota bacterium]